MRSNKQNILQTELEKLEKRAPAPEAELSPERSERICQKTIAKLAVLEKSEAAQPQLKVVHGRAKRAFRTGIAAAALVCVGSVSVYAAGAMLLPMLKGKIDFFQNAPSSQQAEDPLSAPRGEYSAVKTSLEAFNTPVGAEIVNEDMTLTLDSISMDVSGMDLFMTVTGQEAIQQVLNQKDSIEGEPIWSKFFGEGPHFWNAEINGKKIVRHNAMEGENWYLAEDGSLKLWQHYLFTQVPQGDEIRVNLKEGGTVLGREGDWSLPVISLDGASVRSGSRIAQTCEIAAPNVDRSCGISEELAAKQTLKLDYLAFGPKGGVISAEVDTEHKQKGYVYPENFYFTDDTGKELFMTGIEWNDPITANLTAPSPEATSITVTPVYRHYTDQNGNYESEKRTVSSADLKAGAKLETSPLGGYAVQNYLVKDGSISFELVPYGYVTKIELLPLDEGKISMSDGHSALRSENVDPQTGIITVRYDYYKASQAELESVEEWGYPYVECELGSEYAVTLPLKPAE